MTSSEDSPRGGATLDLGLTIRTSEFAPEFGTPEALPDAEDRLHAMTLHHIDLSLLDLTSVERVAFNVGGCLVVHPNNLPRLHALGVAK